MGLKGLDYLDQDSLRRSSFGSSPTSANVQEAPIFNTSQCGCLLAGNTSLSTVYRQFIRGLCCSNDHIMSVLQKPFRNSKHRCPDNQGRCIYFAACYST